MTEKKKDKNSEYSWSWIFAKLSFTAIAFAFAKWYISCTAFACNLLSHLWACCTKFQCKKLSKQAQLDHPRSFDFARINIYHGIPLPRYSVIDMRSLQDYLGPQHPVLWACLNPLFMCSGPRKTLIGHHQQIKKNNVVLRVYSLHFVYFPLTLFAYCARDQRQALMAGNILPPLPPATNNYC